jgi:hypothetical protein
MPAARVTVTLPEDVVRDIDHVEPNRSRFVLRAVRSELERVHREAFRKSLAEPHPESISLAEAAIRDWAAQAPGSKADEDLLDPKAGTSVSWNPAKGWQARKR